MILRQIFLFLAILSMLPGAFAQTNYLNNGDFETAPTEDGGDIDDQGHYTQTISGTTTYTLQNWTFGRIAGTATSSGGPRMHWFSSTDRPGWSNPPQSGSYAIQLNTDSFTDKIYVQQATNANLVSGQTYRLSFYYIDESAFNNQVGVTVRISRNSDDSTINATDFTYTSSGTDTWQLGQISFVAPSADGYTVRFTDLVPSTNNQQNIILDNITLYAVPETATFAAAAMLAGFALTVRSRRRHRSIRL